MCSTSNTHQLLRTCLVLKLWYVFNARLSFLHSIRDDFMKSFQTQQIMWATDWPVTRRITRSPTPLPSTLPCRFCPSTPTTLHNQPLQPPAAAAPARQKTPSLLRHSPRPSSNTPLYRACPPLPQEWRHILSPKSSTSDSPQTQTFPVSADETTLIQSRAFSEEEVGEVCWTLDRQEFVFGMRPLWAAMEFKRQCIFLFVGLGSKSSFETFSLFRIVFHCGYYFLKREDCWTKF